MAAELYPNNLTWVGITDSCIFLLLFNGFNKRIFSFVQFFFSFFFFSFGGLLGKGRRRRERILHGHAWHGI